MPDLPEPTLDTVVETVTDAARETISGGTALARLAEWGLKPTALDWHEATNNVLEADDLADRSLDAIAFSDVPVYDVDGFRRHLIDERLSDVRELAKAWLLDRLSTSKSVVEYGVAYPGGRVVHTFRGREVAEQRCKRESIEGSHVVEQTVTTTKTRWRPARKQVGAKPALAVVR